MVVAIVVDRAVFIGAFDGVKVLVEAFVLVLIGIFVGVFVGMLVGVCGTQVP